MAEIMRASYENEAVQPDFMGITDLVKLNWIPAEKVAGLPDLVNPFRQGYWNVFRYSPEWVAFFEANNIRYWLFTSGYHYEQEAQDYRASVARVQAAYAERHAVVAR